MKFNLELVKDSAELRNACSSHLKTASFEVVKELKEASLGRVKTLQNDLQQERLKLFDNFDLETAQKIWNRVRREMNNLNHRLKMRERKKLAKTTGFGPTTIQMAERSAKRRDNRRFQKHRRNENRGQLEQNETANAPVTAADSTEFDLKPINLSSQVLTTAEENLLSTGPSFCPVPKDINWQKTHEDIEKFERRIRLASFFHNKEQKQDEERVEMNMPPVPSVFSEVELFLSEVRNDILNPKNSRKPKDNLSKEERHAMKNLKIDDRVIRIQDKGSRFVLLDQKEYAEKMSSQLDNTLHYAKLPEDPTQKHLKLVKDWSSKWRREGQITDEIADWVTNTRPRPGTAFGNVKTQKSVTRSALLLLVAEQRLKSYLPLLNII